MEASCIGHGTATPMSPAFSLSSANQFNQDTDASCTFGQLRAYSPVKVEYEVGPNPQTSLIVPKEKRERRAGGKKRGKEERGKGPGNLCTPGLSHRGNPVSGPIVGMQGPRGRTEPFAQYGGMGKVGRGKGGSGDC